MTTREREQATEQSAGGGPAAAGERCRLRDSWSVQSKFLMVTGLILLLNCLLMALVIFYHERGQLEEVAYAKSELVLGAVEASRAYVREELRPAMDRHFGSDYFIPEAMSTSYVGRAVVDRFAPTMADYNYRRVAINARNPSYEANELERRMIDHFIGHPGQTEWRGLVQVDGRKKFKRFRPVYFEQDCLRCHGRPEDAPEIMVQMYGDTLGFNRRAGELSGLVAVGVPVEAALAEARERAVSIFLVVFAGMALVFIALSFFFHRMVILSLRGVLEIFHDHDEVRLEREEAAAELVEDPEVSAVPVPDSRSPAPTQTQIYRDELVELMAAACTMAAHLRQTRQQLRRYARELESRVEERTRALRLSEARLQQKEMEEKIQHTEKMVAMGQMVAGLAHEINNPLGVILCYLDLVKRQTAADAGARHDLEVIEKQVRSCKRIVGDLLEFARGGSSLKELASLNRAISEVAGMVASQFCKQKVEIGLNLAPELPSLWLDINKIKQVLLNLLMNACQAMPTDGGRVEITSLRSAAGDRALVLICDNGRGIAPGNLARIFEPFFSTKGTGEGSGLGLAVSYGIIKEHGGEIEVESRAGEGACFTIEFPLNQEPPAEEQ